MVPVVYEEYLENVLTVVCANTVTVRVGGRHPFVEGEQLTVVRPDEIEPFRFVTLWRQKCRLAEVVTRLHARDRYTVVADAGSEPIPSIPILLLAFAISSSETCSTRPPVYSMVNHDFSKLTGLPIFIAEALVSASTGCSIFSLLIKLW